MTQPAPNSPTEALLDNPIWSSLTTRHAHLALGAHTGQSLARRYPADIGPLSALREPTPAAYANLADLIPQEDIQDDIKDDIAVLFLEAPPNPPAGWQLTRSGTLVQMICRTPPLQPATSETILPLQPSDYPEMLALATLTEPGPFRANTPTLGGFLGIRIDGRLAAMAGQRLSPTGFTEVSAVCTHPDFRGRGLALALVAAVARNIHAAGNTPFLTSFEHNTAAIRIYRQANFAHRRTFQLAVLKPPPRHT